MATREDWLEVYRRCEAGEGLRPEQQERVRRSLSILVDAHRLYEGALVPSFNGGKDATVILFLTLAARAEWSASHRVPAAAAAAAVDTTDAAAASASSASSASSSASVAPLPLPATRALYYPTSDGFPELHAFVGRMAGECDLDMIEYRDVDFMSGLRDCIDNKGARAFVMGTRKDDPAGKGLHPFSPSSRGWPAFMRVNPILEWEFEDVWDFIRVRFRRHRRGWAYLGVWWYWRDLGFCVLQ